MSWVLSYQKDGRVPAHPSFGMTPTQDIRDLFAWRHPIHNFSLAIILCYSLAQAQQYDQDGVIEIFRQYGDHLYSKGDHDGAIAQYIKTIGKLEASYVIRKVSI